MPRYFFELHEGGDVIEDESGRELENSERAYLTAIAEARAIMSDDVGNGVLCLDHVIVVRDNGGTRLFEVVFRNAIDVVITATR